MSLRAGAYPRGLGTPRVRSSAGEPSQPPLQATSGLGDGSSAASGWGALTACSSGPWHMTP
eukprot:9639812-Lingulodinium_polyedra.AAC.1